MKLNELIMTLVKRIEEGHDAMVFVRTKAGHYQIKNISPNHSGEVHIEVGEPLEPLGARE
jgi:hypothetical protein